jgi:hypothetical protein
MPYGSIQIPGILRHNGHGNMGKEIVGDSRQNALKDIRGLSVPALLKIGLAQETVGFYVLGESTEDILTMGDGLVKVPMIDHVLYFLLIGAQRYLGHRQSSLKYAPSQPKLQLLRKD